MKMKQVRSVAAFFLITSIGQLSAIVVATDTFDGGSELNGGTGWAADWTMSNTFFPSGQIDGNSLGGFGSGSTSRQISPVQTTAGDLATLGLSLRSNYDINSLGGTELGVNFLDSSGNALLTLKFANGSGDLLVNDGGNDFGSAGLTFATGEIYDFAFSSVIGSSEYSFTAAGRGASGSTSGTDFTYSGRSTGSIGGFEVFWTGPGESGNDIFLDNVSVDIIPEPSVALLNGLGIFALLRRRRA